MNSTFFNFLQEYFRLVLLTHLLNFHPQTDERLILVVLMLKETLLGRFVPTEEIIYASWDVEAFS